MDSHPYSVTNRWLGWLTLGLGIVFGVLLLSKHTTAQSWAFSETFDGDPASPSQDLLPRTFDYAVTHRTHPREHFTLDFDDYPADHDENCAGPNPAVSPLPQHMVNTRQNTNGATT